MIIFCTHCTASKDKTEGLVPAIKRYESNRIRQVYAASLCVGADFFILSGKYHLVKPCQVIPFYDYQLQPEQVLEHSDKIVSQISEFGISGILYFTKPVSEDSHAKTYLESVSLACGQAGISFFATKLGKGAY
ncbi:MAG: hypothetical protein GY749_04265 [Desulfobacteraceae bacterium]|nr:hypothetical protein [Desulfobacteraceae bacterium]